MDQIGDFQLVILLMEQIDDIYLPVLSGTHTYQGREGPHQVLHILQ
jgi:hypothetical protein